MVIPVSIYGTLEIKVFVNSQLNIWNSVSVFATKTCSPISYEAQYRCPSGLRVRVDFHIKADPELRTPAGNCSNQSIFLDDSRETDVLPDQVSV